MQSAPFHQRLDELVSTALLYREPLDPDLQAADEHASSGCSLCARALVNAREISAELTAALPPMAPGASLRAKILTSARARGLAPSSPAEPPQKPSKTRDPSAFVAHLHLADPSEIERARQVAELDARLALNAPDLKPLLANVQRLIDFPILFVSVIRGERVDYLAELGLPEALRGMGGMRREMTFCSHCVSAGRPLLVGDAASEPFSEETPRSGASASGLMPASRSASRAPPSSARSAALISSPGPSPRRSLASSPSRRKRSWPRSTAASFPDSPPPGRERCCPRGRCFLQQH